MPSTISSGWELSLNLLHAIHLFIVLCTIEASYAPALHFVERFRYSPITINEALEFNCAFRRHLRGEQSLYEAMTDYRTALAETGQRFQAWDSLRDAKHTLYTITVRRVALGKLLDLIGQDAFLSGQMPEPVSQRWFSVVRWE